MIFDFMVNILEIKVHMYSFFMSDFSLAFFSTFFLSYISDYTTYSIFMESIFKRVLVGASISQGGATYLKYTYVLKTNLEFKARLISSNAIKSTP